MTTSLHFDIYEWEFMNAFIMTDSDINPIVYIC